MSKEKIVQRRFGNLKPVGQAENIFRDGVTGTVQAKGRIRYTLNVTFLSFKNRSPRLPMRPFAPVGRK